MSQARARGGGQLIMIKFPFGRRGDRRQLPSEVDRRSLDDLLVRGNRLEDSGDVAGAQRLYEQAADAAPPYWRAFVNLGNALRKQDLLDRAIENYRIAVRLDPDQSGAHQNLATALLRAGDAEASEASYRSAIAGRPDWDEAWFGLGCALEQGKLGSLAISAYRHALSLNPRHSASACCIARLLTKEGDGSSARDVLALFLQQTPDDAQVLNALAEILKQSGEADAAVALYRRRLALRHDDFETFSNYLFTLNLDEGTIPNFLLDEHVRFGRLLAERTRRIILETEGAADKRLRIGYVSPDFRRHSVSCFVEAVLEHHDSSGFEIYCYYNHSDRDDITARFAGLADHWRDIAGVDDERVAQTVVADEIDILVDLAGHTSGNRLSLFASKPAPLQFTWLGYLCTTGLEAIDFRICDSATDPPRETERWQTETPARLPHSQWCYHPQSELPPISPLPMLRNGYCTFGSFNQAAKLNRGLLQLWANALSTIPGSRLRIIGVTDQVHRQAIQDIFYSQGVARERLDIFSRVGLEEYFSSYANVDIALDSLPYNGATTTCDALIMGVPVATIAGERSIERGGASLLGTLELNTWIARSRDDFASMLKRQLRSVEELARLRGELRTRMLASPLMDEPRFTRDIERLFRKAWREYCIGTTRA